MATKDGGKPLSPKVAETFSTPPGYDEKDTLRMSPDERAAHYFRQLHPAVQEMLSEWNAQDVEKIKKYLRRADEIDAGSRFLRWTVYGGLTIFGLLVGFLKGWEWLQSFLSSRGGSIK